MPTQADLQFAQAALRLKLITQQQATEALMLQQAIEAAGVNITVLKVMLDKKFLSEAQVKQVQQFMGLDDAVQKKLGRVGNYELISQIGRGAMGTVFKARQLSTDRLVAVKILHPRLAKDRQFIVRFRREAQAAAKLSHPNIVQGIEVGQSPDGYHYFVMEFVDGPSVQKLLKERGRLSEGEALKITSQVARALDHASEMGIVHRDIKPDNILLTKDGMAKLSDLGLAKEVVDSSLTLVGVQLGTPLYMAPEQARGEASVDSRSDIYSLGATLYHMVTGQPPFQGETAAVVITKHLQAQVPSPREKAPYLSDGICHIIEKMLAKDQADRYQTPAELLRDLELVAAGKDPVSVRIEAAKSSVRAAALRGRRQQRAVKESTTLAWAGLSVGLCVLFLLVVITLVSNSGKSSRPPTLAVAPPTTQQAGETESAPPVHAEVVELDGIPAQLLKSADEYRLDHPEDLAGQLERYNGIVQRFPGRNEAIKASEIAKQIEQEQDREAAAELATLTEKAEALAREKKYGAAAAVFDTFPERLASKRRREELARLKMSYVNAASEWFDSVKSRADELVAQGKFAEARRVYEPALQSDLPEIQQRAERRVKDIEVEALEAKKRAEETAAAAHRDVMKRLIPFLAARQYAEALAAVDAAIKSGKYPGADATLLQDRADVQRLMAFWRRVAAGAARLKPGEEVSVRGIKAPFVGFEGGKLILGAADAQVVRDLMDLRAAEAVELAEYAPDKSADEARLQVALFYICDRDRNLPAARAELARVKAEPDRSRYLELCTWIETGEGSTEPRGMPDEGETGS